MSEKIQKFNVLLEQMQLAPDVVNQLTQLGGRIEGVIVHRQSRIWEFTLGFTEILPVSLYQLLNHHLLMAFREIATTRLNVQTDAPQLNEALLQDYWPLVLSDEHCNTKVVNQTIKNQLPLLEDKKVVISVNNQAIIPHLVDNYFPWIEDCYQKLGFPKFRLEARYDEEQAEAAVKELEAKKAEQAEVMMQQAMENLAAHEQQKKEKKNTPAPLQGPLQLGRNIPLMNRLPQ